jgi:fibronectin-binding autotransporter adhesin
VTSDLEPRSAGPAALARRPSSLARRSLGVGGSVRSLLAVAGLLTFGLFIPSASAFEWQNSGIFDSDSADRAFSSGPAWFTAGPAWMMNAMPGSHFRARQYVIDSAGDRQESTTQYNGYVGTLHDAFDVSLFGNVSTFGGLSTSKTSTTRIAALNGANNYTGSATGNVTTAGNWSAGVPTITNDAVFTSTSNTGIKNFGGGATVGPPLTVGSLDVTATSGSYSIRNDTSSATNATLTLGGSGNLGNGVSGVSADLLYAAAGSTLQLLGTNGGGGSGVLNVVLGQSGNFNAAGTINISSIISDGGSGFAITKTGAGTLTLSGVNTYTGLTDVQAGTLAYGTNNVTADTASLKVSGGTLDIVTFTDTVAGVQLTSGTITGSTGVLTSTSAFDVQSGTVSAILGGSVGLNKTTGGTVTLSKANTYTGLTNITAGTLAEGVSNAIATGDLTVNGATAIFDLGASHSDSVGTVTLDGGGAINGTGTSTLTSTGTFEMKSGTVGAILAGSGIALNKTTGGTVTLSGANTYSGGTTLTAGTLNLNAAGSGATSSAIGTGSFTINGGTIDNTTAGAITLSTNNAITLGGSFAFGGTQNLNLGTGAVTNAGDRTITLNGTSKTLTFGTMTNTSNAVQTTTINGAGNTLSLGGYALSDNATSRIDIINGSGNVAITGAVTNGGTATASGLTYSGSGTLTLSGTNTFNGALTVATGTLSIATINNVSANGTLGNSANSVTLGSSGATGTLEYTGASASSTKPFTFASGGTGAFQIDTSGTTLTLSGLIDGGGGLTKLGAGQLNLTGATNNTYTGTTTVSVGTLGLGMNATINAFGGDLTINGGTVSYIGSNDNQIPDSSNVTMSSGGFDLGARTETINSLTMSGGTLTKAGNALTLSSASSITGGTVSLTTTSSRINTTGTLTVGAATFNYSNASASTQGLVLGGDISYAASNTAAATFNNTLAGAGRINLNGATRTFNIADSTTLAAGTPEVEVAWSVQNGTLVKDGSGVLALTGANTYTGTTTISGGTLQLGNGGTTGTLSTSSAITDNANFTIKRSNTVTQGTDFSGAAIAGSGSFTQAGTGTTVLTANTYSGGTTVNDGLLQLNSSTALGSTSGSLTVNAASGNAAILNLNGNSVGVGNLTGTGGNIWNHTNADVTLTIGNGNNGGGNYVGLIQNNNPSSGFTGKVALTKTGTGTITLSGANTYTGATAVSGGGTLFINGDQSAATGATTVTGAGTVLGGTGTIGGNVTVGGSNAATIIEGGTGSTGQTLTVKGSLTMQTGSIIELALGASATHSTLALTAAGTSSFYVTQQFTFIDLGAQTATLYSGIITGVTTPVVTTGWTIDNPGWSGAFVWDAANNEIDLTLTAVPESSTWIGAALALGAIGWTQRKRFAKRSRRV